MAKAVALAPAVVALQVMTMTEMADWQLEIVTKATINPRQQQI